MIYFLHGNDTEKGRTKAHELIGSLQKKKPDASFFKMDAETFDETKLQEYAGGQGLFESKYIIFLDRLCEEKKIKDSFLSYIKEIAESTNIFIVLEGKLDKVSSGKIEKKAEKTQEFVLAEKPEKEKFNVFALAEALGKKDRKNLWILYRQAIDRGEAPEALHGMLFWKVKTMMMNSYGSTYSKEELENLLERIVAVNHDARRGLHEMETGMEALILSL
jgi:DNA polymerase III delta subunit